MPLNRFPVVLRVVTLDLNPEIKELVALMLGDHAISSAEFQEKIAASSARMAAAGNPLSAISSLVARLMELTDSSFVLSGDCRPVSASAGVINGCAVYLDGRISEAAQALEGNAAGDPGKLLTELSELRKAMAGVLCADCIPENGEDDWHRKQLAGVAALARRLDDLFLSALKRLDYLAHHYFPAAGALHRLVESLALALDFATESGEASAGELAIAMDVMLTGRGSHGTGSVLRGALYLLQARIRGLRDRNVDVFRTAIVREDRGAAQIVGNLLCELLFEEFLGVARPELLFEQTFAGKYAGGYRAVLERCLVARKRCGDFLAALGASLEMGAPVRGPLSPLENLIVEVVLLAHGRGLEAFVSLDEVIQAGGTPRARPSSEEERRAVQVVLQNAKCAVLGIIEALLAKQRALSAHPPVLVDLEPLLELAPTPEFLLAGLNESAGRILDRLCADLVDGVRWCHTEDLPDFLHGLFAMLTNPEQPAGRRASLLQRLSTALFSRENSIYSVARATALRKFVNRLRSRPELAADPAAQSTIERIEKEGWLPEEWDDIPALEKSRQILGDEFHAAVREPLRELVNSLTRIFRESSRQGLDHSLEWQIRDLDLGRELEMLELS